MSHGGEVVVDPEMEIWRFRNLTSPYQRSSRHSDPSRNHVALRSWEACLRYAILQTYFFTLANTSPVVVLIINAIAVLSEDRFLARSASLPVLQSRTSSHQSVHSNSANHCELYSWMGPHTS